MLNEASERYIDIELKFTTLDDIMIISVLIFETFSLWTTNICNLDTETLHSLFY